MQHRCVHPQARRWAQPLAAGVNWQVTEVLPLLPTGALGQPEQAGPAQGLQPGVWAEPAQGV